MGDFLNVTSEARAGMYMPYRKQVKMPEVKAQEVRRSNGGKQETEYFYSHLFSLSLMSAFHWPLNNPCPRPETLAMGCLLHFDRCRQNHYIIKFLKSLTKAICDPREAHKERRCCYPM